MYKTGLITTAVAAGALFVPGVAQAHVQIGVSSVKAHTSRADAALDRAVSLFDRHAAGRADRSFVVSRREMAAAKREAAALRRQADTPREELQGARAQALVALEQDQNIDKLTEALDGARGRSERRVAAAALADTGGRERSLAVLTVVVGEVPEQAREGIARAIAARSQGRDEEIAGQSQALVDRDVSSKSKQTVAQSVQANVEGQATGAQRLATLIAGDEVPEEGKAGLRKAYDAVDAEHGSVADILSRLSDRMPAQIRSFVEKVVTQARQDAQSMRDNRPAPPSGQPQGTPSGQPAGTPTAGQPQDTPSGQPAGTPTAGQPQDTPSGQPAGTPTAGQPQDTPSGQPAGTPTAGQPQDTPSGQPAGTPTAGQPQDTPSGQPAGTPTAGQPQDTPSGQPAGTPTAGQPQDTPSGQPAGTPTAGQPQDTPSGQPAGTPTAGQPQDTPSGQPAGTPTAPR